jgi:hypothetical protein
MKNVQAEKIKRIEKEMIAGKRARQARSRDLVELGQRTQESMFLIAPAIARAAIVEHRVFSFD